MKVDAKKILLDSIDVEKLCFAIIDEVLEPALDEVVKDSANPVDDAIKALVYPPLELELKKLITKKVAELKS